MSKILDALRKAEGTAPEAGIPVPPPPGPVPPLEMEPVRPAEIQVGSSGLDLPLEFALELGVLRGKLDQILAGRVQRTLMVAGAVEGEGASTVAAAFARLLAEDERVRVALVDADLRGALRRLPAVDGRSGFPGVLGGRLDVREALVGTTLPNLVVLPGGVAEDSPLRLCTAENCRQPVEYLRHHFHYVVFDAAPLLEAPEMHALASLMDGTILVVRASRTKREVVQRAIETIDKSQGRVLGAILNRQHYVIPEFIYRRL
jgi:capsular exopolysaccharide synthesis family protein